MKIIDVCNTAAPIHPKERERLQSLKSLQLLDSDPSSRFDVITNLASNVFNVPIALISLVDTNRQWFLSNCGLAGKETHRDEAFCAHAIHEKKLLVVEDARSHPIFKHNSLVTGEPFIQFYAGAVIRDGDNLPLGTLCIIDQAPRILTELEKLSLIAMANLVRQEIIQPEELTKQRVRNKLHNNKDPLTNVLLGSAFFEEINLKLSQQDDVDQYYMLCLEIANIESIDNYYGSVVADEVILELSARLKGCVSRIGKSIHGRIDNNHFGVLIAPDSASNHPITPSDSVTSQLQKCLSGSITTSAADIEPCVNLTLVPDKFNEMAPDELYRLAQICVKNLSQKAGINTVIVTDEIRQHNVTIAELTRDLAHAIEKDQLHLVYQPKIDAFTEQLVGLESLLRWEHRKHGFVSPLTIIKMADETNLTYQLEKWIFKTVIKQAKKWRDEGFDIPRVSINVTGDTLQHREFVTFIAEQLQQSGLSGESFDIEILESSLFEDINAVIKVMRQLANLGLSFSLDDFGTGFSNLAYLKTLPISYLKIDKSFIDDITEDPSASAMCSGIISLAHGLGLQTVAEGVELESQAIALRAMRCNLIQGYFYSKPLEAKNLEVRYFLSSSHKSKTTKAIFKNPERIFEANTKLPLNLAS